jgi:hypothetical protein
MTRKKKSAVRKPAKVKRSLKDLPVKEARKIKGGVRKSGGDPLQY